MSKKRAKKVEFTVEELNRINAENIKSLAGLGQSLGTSEGAFILTKNRHKIPCIIVRRTNQKYFEVVIPYTPSELSARRSGNPYSSHGPMPILASKVVFK